MFTPRPPNVRTTFDRDPGQIHRPLPSGPLTPIPAPQPQSPTPPDSKPATPPA
jgi:hypothetical protein